MNKRCKIAISILVCIIVTVIGLEVIKISTTPKEEHYTYTEAKVTKVTEERTIAKDSKYKYFLKNNNFKIGDILKLKKDSNNDLVEAKVIKSTYVDYGDNGQEYEVNPVTLEILDTTTVNDAINADNNKAWYIGVEDYNKEKDKREKYKNLKVKDPNTIYTSYVHQELKSIYPKGNTSYVANMKMFSYTNLK